MAGFSIWNKLTEGNPEVGRAQLGHVEDGNCHVGNQECQSGFPSLQGRRVMEAGPGNFWNLCALRCILFIYFLGKITLVPLRGENNFNPRPQKRILVPFRSSFQNFRQALLSFFIYGNTSPKLPHSLSRTVQHLKEIIIRMKQQMLKRAPKLT